MVTDDLFKTLCEGYQSHAKIGLAKFYPVSGVHKHHRQMADDRQQIELL